MSDHVVYGNRSVFIRGRAVVIQSEAADGACVDDSLDAFIVSGLHDVVRAFDVGGIHVCGMFDPESIVCRAVIDNAAALGSFSNRVEISEIACYDFDRKLIQVIEPACATSETANLLAAFEQNSNEMRSKEPGSAGDKSFHLGIEM